MQQRPIDELKHATCMLLSIGLRSSPLLAKKDKVGVLATSIMQESLTDACSRASPAQRKTVSVALNDLRERKCAIVSVSYPSSPPMEGYFRRNDCGLRM
jgi:hypothetical protein